MKKVICISVFFFFNLLAAQDIDLGSWNILNARYSLTDNLNVFSEVQIRSLKFYNQFHYYEYKGGINYSFHKNAIATFGLGSYQTFNESGNFALPKNNDEFRIWPQLVFTQNIGIIKIEQRYRLECRFTSNGYRNRFRYRIGLSIPFGTSKQDYKPFQVYFNNELFFTDNEPFFERNRMSLGLNHKLSKTETLQIGYLHQFDYKINDETGRDFLQVAYYIEFLNNKKNK
jgi:hypothetical protein